MAELGRDVGDGRALGQEVGRVRGPPPDSPATRRKSFLRPGGIAFTARNVAEDPAAREELIARTGRMAVPVITVDDEVVVGFDRGRLERLLRI